MAPTIRGAWIGVAGAGTFFLGAAIATTVGVWDLSGPELLDGVSRAAVAWRWGNALLAVGSATAAVGMLQVASGSPTTLARSGAILWVLAGACGLVGFILQGEGTFHAATAWSEIRAIPPWFGSVARITGIAIGIFMAGGIIGSVALGWDMRASQGLSTGLLTSGAAVLGLALLFAIMSVPAAAPLLAVWVAVARLLLERT